MGRVLILGGIFMGRHYEREDYTQLLKELQFQNSEKTAVPTPDTARAFVINNFMILMEFLSGNPDISERDVRDAAEEILPIFSEILKNNRRGRNYQEETGCVDKKEAARIVTWLKDIENAVEERDEEAIGFYSAKLLDETDFMAYADHFRKWTPEDRKDSARLPAPSQYEKRAEAERRERQRILSSEKIRFIRDRDRNMIHDKSCRRVRDIPVDGMDALEDYDASCTICPECAMKAYIRCGARDFDQYEEYIKLFRIMDVSGPTVRKMYTELGFVTKLSHMKLDGLPYANVLNNAITVWYREDTWRIGAVRKGRVRLEHNNYRPIGNGKREFTPGFHVQNSGCFDAAPGYVLGIIRNYRYEDHFIERVAGGENTASRAGARPALLDKTAAAPVPAETGEKKEGGAKPVSFFRRILHFFRRDRIRKLRDAAASSRPANGQLCLYLWQDASGDRKWGAGWYNAKKRFFSASYGMNGIRVSFSYVIQWVPLDDIDI